MLPELTCKNTVTVSHNHLQQTMESIDIIQEELCHKNSSEWVTKWYKVTELREFVDDNQDCIVEPDCGRPSMKSMEMTVQAELGTGNG
jgi:hypothetical protein